MPGKFNHLDFMLEPAFFQAHVSYSSEQIAASQPSTQRGEQLVEKEGIVRAMSSGFTHVESSHKTSKRPRPSDERAERLSIVKRACEPCRRSKLKCGQDLPCSQCVSRGIQELCIRCGSPGKLVIQPKSPGCYSSSPSFDSVVKADPSEDLFSVIPLIEFGWNRDEVWAWLQGLPESICNQVMQALKDAQAIRAAKLARNADAFVSESGEGVSRVNALEHDLWNGHPSIGVFQCDYDSETGNIVSIYANQRFATILGLSRQELLTRVASKDLFLAVPHFDLTLYVLRDLTCPSVLVDETAIRVMQHGKKTPTFIRAQKQRTFDGCGRLGRVTHFWEIMSQMAFDNLSERTATTGSFAPRITSNTPTGLTVEQFQQSSDAARYQIAQLGDYANYVVTKMASRMQRAPSLDSPQLSVHEPQSSHVPSPMSRTMQVENIDFLNPKDHSTDPPSFRMAEAVGLGPYSSSRLKESSLPGLCASLLSSSLAPNLAWAEAQYGQKSERTGVSSNSTWANEAAWKVAMAESGQRVQETMPHTSMWDSVGTQESFNLWPQTRSDFSG